MKRNHIRVLAALAAAFVAGQASAEHPRGVILEHGIETASDLISLPSRQDGLLMVRTCETCESAGWRMDANTQLFVGSRRVTLEQMADYVKGLREPKNATVAYRSADHIVSRVVVSLQ